MIFPTFHRILNDAVVNFPNNQEEITLVVSPETLKVKNYVDDEPGKKKKKKSKIDCYLIVRKSQWQKKINYL